MDLDALGGFSAGENNSSFASSLALPSGLAEVDSSSSSSSSPSRFCSSSSSPPPSCCLALGDDAES